MPITSFVFRQTQCDHMQATKAVVSSFIKWG